jgi:hypothetical protein
VAARKNFGTLQSPNGNPDADTEVSRTSHEAMESITDPDISTGWYDSSGYENGDECAYVYGATQGTPCALYSQVIGGRNYLTQEDFSDRDFFSSRRRLPAPRLTSSVMAARSFGSDRRQRAPPITRRGCGLPQMFSLVVAAAEPIRVGFRGRKLAAMLNTAAARSFSVGRREDQRCRRAAHLGSSRARDVEGGEWAAMGDAGHHPQLAP